MHLSMRIGDEETKALDDEVAAQQRAAAAAGASAAAHKITRSDIVRQMLRCLPEARAGASIARRVGYTRTAGPSRPCLHVNVTKDEMARLDGEVCRRQQAAAMGGSLAAHKITRSAVLRHLLRSLAEAAPRSEEASAAP